ncbi:MAG: inorganic phosphate transporter [Bacteroidaceae bacterium]|nr:inorganic phosphate transporter [Bacteroidaceae bacterium]
MVTFYFFIVIFLMCLAIFDLLVGVSNDAVNFLNSAIGSKAASFKTIIIVAGFGIFLGASFSNGMMDIARHGIYQPENFYFAEIMCILLGVMLTDVVLLDLFNTLGMPTSTTVSMVFELLGGTFAMSIIKMNNNSLYSMGNLINTDKALSVIIAIFVSVAIAFFFGMVVQWLARIVFSFNYSKNAKYSIGIFGGIAITCIFYFMLIKGVKSSSFMTPYYQIWIQKNTTMLILGFFIFFSIITQLLYWIKVNVFKIIVLLGTFALALAFASNDLVNFIGVPLAGYSSFIDYVANGTSAGPNGFLMSSLLQPAQTPWYFLIGAGIVMIYALATSKKARNVIKTSVDLSRQDEGKENFGSSPIARLLVRQSMNLANFFTSITPHPINKWIDSRFNQDEVIIEDGAAFDLIRASVNLVLASLLITLGTSLKLPLSTTYVTFMVAMGSSLADRAWGRNSAVYRITGVLSVIGGWFITAGAAFLICFIVTFFIYFGGSTAIVILIILAIFAIIRSQVLYRKKNKKEKGNETFNKLINTDNNKEAFELMRKNTREELCNILQYSEDNYELTVSSFLHENHRGLKRALGAAKFEKQIIKQIKSSGVIAMGRLDEKTVAQYGIHYYQGNSFASEITYSILRLCQPCFEHVDNNFEPLDAIQKGELEDLSEDITYLIQRCRKKLEGNYLKNIEEEIERAKNLIEQISKLRHKELHRIQSREHNLRLSMIYLDIIQESENVINYTIDLLKVSRKFQTDKIDQFDA